VFVVFKTTQQIAQGSPAAPYLYSNKKHHLKEALQFCDWRHESALAHCSVANNKQAEEQILFKNL
jgi:hypothetical protein